MCYISHKHSCFASYLECCSQPSSALSSSVMNVTKPLHRAWCPKPAHSEQCSQILRGFPAVLCTIAPTFPPTPMLGWKPGSHTAGPVTVYLSVFFVCRSTDFYPPSVLKLVVLIASLTLGLSEPLQSWGTLCLSGSRTGTFVSPGRLVSSCGGGGVICRNLGDLRLLGYHSTFQ
jgi:hypothetical protein